MRAWLFLCAALALVAPALTSAATLNVTPAAVSVSAGETVTLVVQVASTDQSINAVSGTLSYPPELLSVSSISKTSSVVSLWVAEPTYSNAEGTVSWSGVIPNPGYQGSGGRVFAVQLRAKGSGTATLSFAQSSVLANDGNGTNVLTGANPASVTVVASAPSASAPASTPAPASGTGSVLKISSPTHPKEDAWYNTSAPQFAFALPSGTVALRTSIGQNPDAVPSVVYQPPVTSKSITYLPDGEYYFSAQARTTNGWGEINRFRVHIDTVAPDPFDVALEHSADGAITAAFEARDVLSGVERYALLVNGQKVLSLSAADVRGPVTLPPTPAGTSTLLVVAYDKAGNSAEASAEFVSSGEGHTVAPEEGWTFNISIPYDTLRSLAWLAINYLSVALVLCVALGSVVFGVWYAWHRVHRVRRTLLRHLAKTDTALHAELLDIHQTLKEEVERLKKERSARTLTAEETRLLKRLGKLVTKTEQTITAELHRH